MKICNLGDFRSLYSASSALAGKMEELRGGWWWWKQKALLLQQDFYQVILTLKGLSFDKLYRHSPWSECFEIMLICSKLIGDLQIGSRHYYLVEPLFMVSEFSLIYLLIFEDQILVLDFSSWFRIKNYVMRFWHNSETRR